jgi:hypothetical protein
MKQVSSILIRLAEELNDQAMVNSARKFIEGLLKSNDLSQSQLGAYKVKPKSDSGAEGMVTGERSSGVRLQYDGDIQQDDLLGILRDKKCMHDDKEIEIQPEKMPDNASWGYAGKIK